MAQKKTKDRHTDATVQIGVRIPKDMKVKLQELARKEDRTYSKVVVRALATFLSNTPIPQV